MAKRGRKPKGEFSDNSTILSIRLRADTRAALEAACEKSGRPLGQEIQWRVVRTFVEDEKIADGFGSRREYRFFRVLSEAVRMTVERESLLPVEQREAAEGKSWLDEPEKYHRAMHACMAIFRTLSPGTPALSDEEMHDLQMWSQMRGELAAFQRMHQIAGADASLSLAARDEKAVRDALAKRDLGSIVDRLNGKYLHVAGEKFEVRSGREEEDGE